MRLENLTPDIDVIYSKNPNEIQTSDVYYYKQRNCRGYVEDEKIILEKNKSLRDVCVMAADKMIQNNYRKVIIDSYETRNCAIILRR